MTNCRIMLITGRPGVGKTTIVKKLSEDLNVMSTDWINGFFTEDVRDNYNNRIGFNLTDLKTRTTGILARSDNDLQKPKIGKYSVYVKEFEDLALPILHPSQIHPLNLLIIDEIGKMELLSKKFHSRIKQLIDDINHNRILVIATIPMIESHHKPIAIVNDLKAIKNNKLFTINVNNRDTIYKEILECAKLMCNS